MNTNDDKVAKLVARRIFQVVNTDTAQSHYFTAAKARATFGAAEWKEIRAGYCATWDVCGPLTADEVREAFGTGAMLYGETVPAL